MDAFQLDGGLRLYFITSTMFVYEAEPLSLGNIPRHTVARHGDLVRAHKPLRTGAEWSKPK